uniref:GRAM domain containing 4 n=1 Tax=Spermophilus dauricus TaxID=99837 RepID=A0A8C9PP90_SPEDA
MLRRLDKIRFRGHKREDLLDLAESPNASDTECGDELPLKIPRTSPRDSEELRDPAGPGTLIMASGVQDFNRTEFDRLNEIKGHLEIALLEKHFLQEELRKLREETNSEMLRQELERERQRRIELEQKMQEVLKARAEEQPAQAQPTPRGQNRRGQGLSSRLQKWFYERFGEYVEDFRFQPEESTVETEEPLSARRLTENMRRLKRGAKPVTNFVKNLSALSDWYSVYTSAIAFTVYMNAVWHGWAIPMFLFLAILRLSLNYLIARGWRIQWSIVPEVSEAVEPPKEDLTVSEKFQLVLDVAQKAQNLFGKMADILEKIKNLFMWVQPETTQKLYIALWAAFLASCFFPYRLVGLAVGLYAGVKFFLIDFIFKRCPRLRAKYDTPYIVWRSLPTDPQLKERASATMSRRLQTASSRSCVSSAPAGLGRDEDAGRCHSTKKGNFHEIFNLTENERPLAVCENGWRCCLINRDRKMPTDYIRNGVLYVTEKATKLVGFTVYTGAFAVWRLPRPNGTDPLWGDPSGLLGGLPSLRCMSGPPRHGCRGHPLSREQVYRWVTRGTVRPGPSRLVSGFRAWESGLGSSPQDEPGRSGFSVAGHEALLGPSSCGWDGCA